MWDDAEWDDTPTWRKAFCFGHEFKGHLECTDCGETSCDCLAVRWMRRQGYLPPLWEVAMVAAITAWPGSNEHPSGPLRVLSIMMCLVSAGDGE